MSSSNSELKIVWWIDHLGPGGSQRILTRLVEHMADQGARQTVICFNAASDNELTDRIALAGADLYILGKERLLLGFGLLPMWNRLIRRGACDVSVSFLFYSDLLGTMISWLGNVPIRISAQRSSNDHYSKLRCKMISVVLKKATCIVLNNSAYQLTAKRFLPDQTPVCVIPNGVNIRKGIPSERQHRLHAELMLSPDTPLIGCVGRLSVEKRLEDVIRTLALLEDATPHLVLIGDGPQKMYLIRVSESLGITDRVHFLGERQDMDILLHDLSLYVLASSFEGMSNSLMEAMVAGCPVAVSAIDVNLELIGRDTRGWSFPCGGIQELAEVMTEILDFPEQVRSRVGAARAHIKRFYPEQKMLQTWQAVLEKNAMPDRVTLIGI
jgi:glycosyltransferase involved in cell wall biosynthesis